MKEEMDDYDEHPEDDEPEQEDEALFGSANFEFNFGEGKEVPTTVYIVAGLIIMGACAGLFTYTEGFGITDEWTSKDWVVVDADVDLEQQGKNNRNTYVYTYSVDGVVYDGEWTCYTSDVTPTCFHQSTFYTSYHQVSYNPDDPSESDMHPGFTRQIFWESVHWLGIIGFMTLIGLMIFSTGVGKMLGISLPGIEQLDKITPKPDDEDDEHDDPAEPRESDYLP
tara:strand:- start:90 stop:761 length:672 start_codon:yes stop_codon:yes gene_type:complete